MNYLIFSVDSQQFGISLDYVKRVIWAVSVTPVNDTSINLQGMINVHNEVVPVLNIRRSLGLNEKSIDLSDQFMICEFPETKAALWVDRVIEINALEAEECTHNDDLSINDSRITSVLRKEAKLITVYDWESIISQTIITQVNV